LAPATQIRVSEDIRMFRHGSRSFSPAVHGRLRGVRRESHRVIRSAPLEFRYKAIMFYQLMLFPALFGARCLFFQRLIALKLPNSPLRAQTCQFLRSIRREKRRPLMMPRLKTAPATGCRFTTGRHRLNPIESGLFHRPAKGPGKSGAGGHLHVQPDLPSGFPQAGTAPA